MIAEIVAGFLVAVPAFVAIIWVTCAILGASFIYYGAMDMWFISYKAGMRRIVIGIVLLAVFLLMLFYSIGVNMV